ncbi:uncharacterized protein [Ptychodera flava]|uniref:uncharacterized protein n=1 Tax=Ptychodera flava TaxID=63121 RepID=UPI003969C51C
MCIDIDECESEPCLNGGTCTDDVNVYTCACAEGYSGTNCEVAPETEEEVPPEVPVPTEAVLPDVTVIPTLEPCEFPVKVSNVAKGKKVTQSSTNKKAKGDPEKAVDGSRNGKMKKGKFCTQTDKSSSHTGLSIWERPMISMKWLFIP